MRIKYQIALKHEVWGQYMSYIRFLNEKNEIIYSRNVFILDYDHNYNYQLSITKYNKECVLLLEHLRPNISQLSLLNFKTNKVSRIEANKFFNINTICKDFENGNIEVFKNANLNSFIVEKIKIPFWKTWSKSKNLFDE